MLIVGGLCLLQNIAIVEFYFAFSTKTKIEFENSVHQKRVLPYIFIVFDDHITLNESMFSIFKKIECKIYYRNKTAQIISKVSLKKDIDTNFHLKYHFSRYDADAVKFSFNNNFFLKKLYWMLTTPIEKILLYDGTNGEIFHLTVGHYLIKIYQTTFIKQKLPYDTECYDYEDNIKATLNSQLSGKNRCTQDCIIQEFPKYLKCREGVTEMVFSRAKGDYSLDNYTLGFMSCNMFFNSSKTLLRREFVAYDCKEKCKTNCHQINLKPRFILLKQATGQSDKAYLTVQPDWSYSVTIYRSFPQMKMLDLFYEIGGIISLWFGYSIIFLINHLVQIFVYLFQNKILKKSFK